MCRSMCDGGREKRMSQQTSKIGNQWNDLWKMIPYFFLAPPREFPSFVLMRSWAVVRLLLLKENYKLSALPGKACLQHSNCHISLHASTFPDLQSSLGPAASVHSVNQVRLPLSLEMLTVAAVAEPNRKLLVSWGRTTASPVAKTNTWDWEKVGVMRNVERLHLGMAPCPAPWCYITCLAPPMVKRLIFKRSTFNVVKEP